MWTYRFNLSIDYGHRRTEITAKWMGFEQRWNLLTITLYKLFIWFTHLSQLKNILGECQKWWPHYCECPSYLRKSRNRYQKPNLYCMLHSWKTLFHTISISYLRKFTLNNKCNMFHIFYFQMKLKHLENWRALLTGDTNSESGRNRRNWIFFKT